MKILITGSSGFVGKHLVAKLQKKHEIVPFDLKLGFDVLDRTELRRKINGCDAVIHLAAFVSVPESWQKPVEYFENNGLGTLNVVRESINAKVKRFIFFSSASVYGNPLTPYGASKIWGETVCETFKNDLEIVILRPFNIYGGGQDTTYGYAIHNFIHGIKEKGEVGIYGDGKQLRDYINIDDVVSVTEKLLTMGKIPLSPVDLGTGKGTEINELAMLIGKAVSKDFNIKYQPARKEPRISVANITQLNNMGMDANDFVKLKRGIRNLTK